MKKNPFLIGYLAVTAVGAAALGFLVYSGYSQYSEVRANYESQVAKLLSLKHRSPFPNAENTAAYKELTAEYQTEYEKLLDRVRAMQPPLEPLTPSAFQDRLRAVVSEVEAAAQANEVTLAPGFYLGFDRYQGELPSNEAAAPLGRQLAAIRLVVDQLIQNKVREIKAVSRPPLPEETGAAAAEPAPGGRDRNARQQPSLVSSAPFDITFVADQSRLRQALNTITRADQFLVVRALNIVSSQTEGPSKEAPPEETAAAAPAPSADPLADLLGTGGGAPAGEDASAPATSNLRVLVGLETLTVGARIEMLTFNLADSKE